MIEANWRADWGLTSLFLENSFLRLKGMLVLNPGPYVSPKVDHDILSLLTKLGRQRAASYSTGV